MLVPVVAIPVSLIGGVFLMQVFGFTLNLLTLLAIVLSVGLVVDDAIVVVENVERHIREGRTPLQRGAGRRARAGRADHRDDHHAGRGLPPIGFQGGLTGALFREFAFTLAGAVFISGVVALTLSPMMSSRLLRAEHQRRLVRPQGRARVRRGQARLRARRSTRRCARGRRSTRSGSRCRSLIVPMYMFSPKELAPNEDQGVIFGAIDVPANASLEQVTTYSAAGRTRSSRARPSSSTASRSASRPAASAACC